MSYKTYKYGMKYRGYSIACQPMYGLVAIEEGDKEYYNYLYYERRLKDSEIRDYELEYLGEGE